MIKRLLTTIIFFGCIQAKLSAQNFDHNKMDSLLASLSRENKAMGSIVLSKGDKIVYECATGFSQITPRKITPSTERTIYRIGSVTKMYTATMIFQLIEEGKIRLSTHLSDFYPNLPNAQKITIAQLLNHSSGLHNFSSDQAYAYWRKAPKMPQQILGIIETRPVDFEPGTKAVYSNTNYLILGYIIEKITGKSYEEALEDRITNRLQQDNTYYGSKTNPKDHEAFSYSFENNEWIPKQMTDMSIPGGAGALVSTPTDMAAFARALFTGKLVRDSSLRHMKDIKDGYGMGLFQFTYADKTAYGHTGSIDGFSSVLSYFPEDSVAFAWCGNGLNIQMVDLTVEILSIYFNRPMRKAVFQPTGLKKKELGLYPGVYGSKQLPIKIKISRTKDALIAQPTGEHAVLLEHEGEHRFKNDQADIILEFHPEKHELTLTRNGKPYLFKMRGKPQGAKTTLKHYMQG